MTVDINKVIDWFERRKGVLTYSMTGSRNGADGTADCSGSITQALYEAGASKPAFLYSTETIHGYLLHNGFELIAQNEEFTAKRGDIPVMGLRGASAGGAGHVGIISTNDPNAMLLSTCFWTGGTRGTAVQNVRFDDMWRADGSPYFYVYRLKANQAPSRTNTQPTPANTPKSSAIDTFKAGGNKFTAYKPFKVDEISKQFGIWQVLNYNLARGKGTDKPSWYYNGIPLEYLDNVTRGNDAPTQVNDTVKFSNDYNHGTIDDYDTASNGIGIVYTPGSEVWYDADAFLTCV